MARRLLLKEDQLTSTSNPPSGYRWIGYNGATFSERQSDGDIIKTGNPRPYKVYTALLTQSGGDDPDEADNFPLVIGTTYQITNNSGGADFTTAGSPNNEVGTYFVATSSIVNWGNDMAKVSWNTGAPVVTVLENTIGNIWFVYSSIGDYNIFSNGLFTENKTTFSIILMGDDLGNGYLCRGYMQEPNSCSIVTGDISSTIDGVLIWKTPIEIRVYN